MKRNFTWAAGLTAMMSLGLSNAANATFLPENNLWILDDPQVAANITEEQFNADPRQSNRTFQFFEP